MSATDHDFQSPLTIASIILWLICISITFTIGTYTVYRLKKTPKKGIRDLQIINVLTWGICFITFSFANIFYLIWEYFLTNQLLISVFDNLSVLLLHLTVLVKIVDTEYTINKHALYKGYYFSVILIVLMLFSIILTPETVRQFQVYQIIYLVLFISGISIYIWLFLYLGLKTEGRERIMALRMIVFPILLTLSIILLPYNAIIYSPIKIPFGIYYIAPQIIITAVTLLMYSTYKKNIKKIEA